MTTTQTVLYHDGELIWLQGERTHVSSISEIIRALPYGDCPATVWCGGQPDLMDILGMMLTRYPWNPDASRLRLGECTGCISADHSILSLTVRLDGRNRMRFLDITGYCEYGGNAVEVARTLHDLQVTSPTPGSAAVAQTIPRKHMERFARTYPAPDGFAGQLVSQACRGGLVWLDRPGVYHDVIDLDVNSMYPSILASCRLPHGTPTEVDSVEDMRDDQWGVFEVDIMGVERPGMPHWLTRRADGRRGRETPIACDNGFASMTLTSDDIEAVRLSCDAELIVHGGVAFDTCTPFFASSTAKLGWLKDMAPRSGKGVYKTLLNAFVGKFAQAHHRNANISVIPCLDDRGRVVFRTVRCDDAGRGVSTNVRYTPLAAAVWGKARLRLLKDISSVRQAGGEVVYCNTDGFMVRGLDAEALRDILPMGRGQGEYKVEAEFRRVNLLASNLYLGETVQGGTLWCHSGYVGDEVPTWDEFASGRYGHVYSGLS